MPLNDPGHPSHDARYSSLPKDCLPSGESLALTRERVSPYLEDQILPSALRGDVPLVAAHGNSLRAIVMALDGMTPEEILKLNIPTGVPILYTLDESGNARNREFLGDPGQIKAMMDAVANQGKSC